MTQHVIQNLSDLRLWLMHHQIDFSRWGEGATKTIKDLYREIKIGDTKLSFNRRVVDVAIILIKRDGKYLIEVKQEFEDSRVRHRDLPPSEKMQNGEKPLQAAKRCLTEELGLTYGQIKSIKRIVAPYVEERASSSYPGLTSEYRLHIFEAEIEGLPQGEFSIKEVPSSSDEKLKWHTWGWGALPYNIQQALI